MPSWVGAAGLHDDVPRRAHLPHGQADDGMVPPLALAVDDLLIGQHSAQGGAPVDRDLCLVGQAPVEQLQEDPLRPLVVLGVGGAELAVPVEGEPCSSPAG